MRFTALSAALLIGATVWISGCGGGGGTPGFNDYNRFVTRLTRGGFTQDALILAASRSTEARISTDEATRIDAELKKIRDKVPSVKDIHTHPTEDLNSVIATIDADAAWLSNWRNGVKETGTPTLDVLLTELKTAKVEPLSKNADERQFVLTFDDPLNIGAVVSRLNAASPKLAGVRSNGLVGDGDRIRLFEVDGSRIYDFVKKSGDCPAGCISQYLYEVTLNTDGSVAVKEIGPSPTASTAAP